ncbi:hypothetical protein Pcinc_036326 [Petrolisthes cinctipes]|uniref:Uncharacterized protein n=1 Tax=Petrolisthes cinctipes TaxID=88211 RepID=A0AAE1BY01_PETCI|nr:hypothetical protein Pcinc_036326 [Petrolisthes cinctipes]
MKFVILATLAALAVAAPRADYRSIESGESAEILRHDFTIEDDGTYVLGVETSNGIVASQSGAPSGPDDAVVKQGYFSWTAPDGTPVHVKFVADENGYQPESDHLPVAPEFPHPIPQFVLDQIAKAAEEDRGRSISREYSYQ